MDGQSLLQSRRADFLLHGSNATRQASAKVRQARPAKGMKQDGKGVLVLKRKFQNKKMKERIRDLTQDLWVLNYQVQSKMLARLMAFLQCSASKAFYRYVIRKESATSG